MQQRVTPKSLIAENERRDYGRVRNHLKFILSNQSVGLFLEVCVTPSMRLYLPRVEARLRGIIALKAYVAS